MERIPEDVRCWQFRPRFHSKPYTCANKERKLILTSLRHNFIIDTDNYLLTEYIRPVLLVSKGKGKGEDVFFPQRGSGKLSNLYGNHRE